MPKVQIPFGYNTMQVGRVNVYTAKIRVKTDAETIRDIMGDDLYRTVARYVCKEGCNILEWSTTDYQEHQRLISLMNRLLAHVMHSRIAAKYKETVYDSAPVELEW
jgi:hypothetical protein